VRRRCWRRCSHVRHSDSDAGVASELKIKQGSNFYPVENNDKPFTLRRKEKPQSFASLREPY
jgi:hypothetical protein